jgi:hypothetical protein
MPSIQVVRSIFPGQRTRTVYLLPKRGGNSLVEVSSVERSDGNGGLLSRAAALNRRQFLRVSPPARRSDPPRLRASPVPASDPAPTERQAQTGLVSGLPPWKAILGRSLMIHSSWSSRSYPRPGTGHRHDGPRNTPPTDDQLNSQIRHSATHGSTQSHNTNLPFRCLHPHSATA